MVEPVKLGVIGANPAGGWAATAHMPAITAIDAIELVAVATTRRESADAARHAYGARRAYADAAELIADPEVEAVTVAVKVPGHFDLVEQALAAGKHVYCEWPLTADTASAASLRDLATQRGVQTIIGLQTARSAPVRRAAALVADGKLGRPLSASLTITSPLGGARLPQAHAYLADASLGANLLTITGGHALDTLCAVAGEIRELTAVLGSRFPEVTIVETGASIPATSPDQVSIAGTLESGSVISAAIFGGLNYNPTFSLEVRGELGAISVKTVGLSSAKLEIEHLDDAGGRSALESPGVPGALAAVPTGPASFVGMLYLDFVEAIRRGTAVGPDFTHAVRRHELLDAIREAHCSGNRQAV